MKPNELGEVERELGRNAALPYPPLSPRRSQDVGETGREALPRQARTITLPFARACRWVIAMAITATSSLSLNGGH